MIYERFLYFVFGVLTGGHIGIGCLKYKIWKTKQLRIQFT